jgi:WD40 repeat protein
MKTGVDTTTVAMPQMGEAAVSPIGPVALSPNGKVLAIVRSGIVQIWNALAGLLEANIWAHDYTIESIAISHDGRLLATGSADKTIKLWDMASY